MIAFGPWFEHWVVLFFMTFLHEDAAILAAAFLRVEEGMPWGLAYTSIISGVIAGDFIIYGLGHFAQKNAWLRSKIIGPKVEKIKLWLETHLVQGLLLCRITPGLLFPTFVACGWFKIPFKKFALITITSGVLYSSAVLTLIIVFGDLVLVHLDYWAWGILFVVVLAIASRSVIKLGFTKAKERVLSKEGPSFLKVLKKYKETKKSRHSGMPSLDGIKRLVSFAERLPSGLFYLPVGLRWLLLSLRYRSLTLPTVSNPLIETGGYWGESKSDLMDKVGEKQRKWFADFVTFHRNGEGAKADLQVAISLMENQGLKFPVVVKPDVGWQGYGVQLVEEPDHLLTYIESYPAEQKMMLQRPVPHDGEAGIFYVRMPNEKHGRVLSVTLRYFPYVIGDGKSTLEDLIKNSPRSKLKAEYFLGDRPDHMGPEKQYLEMVPVEGELVRLAFIGSIRIGGLYRDASYLITPEMTKRFDEIAQAIPEFYFGRFDVRFESTELLQKGEGFSIIEINGAGSEPIHAWDPEVSTLKLYKELFQTQSLLFKVGALNRERGFKPMGIVDFLKAAKRQTKLINQYPPAG
ncbi:MAG TPA: VTT domain-containing protein [Sunxiuqinia sp.]|nr:VTT domain-containing protein [Sunxiuqinia sp.]